VTISNDGATIMRLLEIVHPAAKCLVDVSLSQDAEVSRHECCDLKRPLVFLCPGSMAGVKEHAAVVLESAGKAPFTMCRSETAPPRW
jgi:hypothetical protein